MQNFTDSITDLCETQWCCMVLLLSACFLVIILPIYFGGLHSSGDLAVFLGFAEDFRSGLVSGDLFPGISDGKGGFGDLGIRFYPPLAPLLTAAIALLTHNMYDAIWIFILVCMFVGCLGVYLFVRDWGTPVQAACAGMLYAIVPFPLAKIYQFSLYAEFAAGSLIPFCFLFASRICRRRHWLDIVLFAVSFSLLILTHIPSTVFTAISLFVYVMFIMDWRNIWRIVTSLGVAAAAALLATSFYWINVLTEVSWLAHYKDEFSTGMYSFDSWLFPNSIPPGDVPVYYLPHFRNIDAMIVFSVLLIVPSVVLWMGRRSWSKNGGWRIVLPVSFTALLALFMTTRASYFIWQVLPVLQKTQFPWRWLTVVSVLSTIAFVLSLPHLWREFPAFRTVIGVFVAGLVMLMIGFDIRQSFARPNIISRAEFQQMANDEFSARAWLPIWADSKAYDMPDKVIANDRYVEIVAWERKERHINVADGAPMEMRVAAFYYPHWRATLNGQVVAVNKDENGVIVIPVGTGSADVHLDFEEPQLNRALCWLSMISWLALGLAMLTRVCKRLYKWRIDTATRN